MAGWVRPFLFILALALPVLPADSAAVGGRETASPDWETLIRRLVRDGQDEAAVRGFFARPEAQFDPRVMPRKLAHRESILDYGRFLRPERLQRARAYLNENQQLIAEIEKEYSVPGEIKVSILLVETDLGNYLGAGLAFNILSSMALASEFEEVRPWLPAELLTSENRQALEAQLKKKSEWAYRELVALIEYCRQNRIDPLALKGSIFGAIGLCQFMPSNALRFGVDHDDDGKVDLFSTEDALASMANYLRHYGWKDGLEREGQERVLLKYNYSRPYASTVLAVAKELGRMERHEYPDNSPGQ